MGASESVDLPFSTNIHTDIKIELEKKSQWFIPGEIVSGTVSIGALHLQKEIITMDLIGELGYKMDYSTDTDVVRTIYRHYPFFTVSKASITDGEKFDLPLDENLPPSINIDKETYPYIRYLIQINFSRTDNYRHWIFVCPRVAIPRSNINALYFDAINRKQLRLTGSINLEWILPNDRFQLEYKIYNPNREVIKNMDGNISMRVKIKGIEYNKKIMDIVFDDVIDTADDQIMGIVSLTLPMRYFPPTFSYKNDKNSFKVSIEYWATIEVHVHGMNTSLKTAIRIMIGFEPENFIFNEVSSTNPHRLSTPSMQSKYRSCHS